MRITDYTQLLIAIASGIAALAAMVTTMISRNALKKQIDIIAHQTNTDQLRNTEDAIRNTPSLLEFYGIKLADLEKAGISPTEFLYIAHNLQAAQTYYMVLGGDYKKVHLTRFRINFLRSEKVRIAWTKFLRDKYFDESAFTQAVDAYYNNAEQDAPADG